MDALILVDVLDSHGNMISRQRLRLDRSGTPLVVGRHVSCDVVLNDPYVAARHARLFIGEDGEIRVADLDSLNGLIVQGGRVRSAALADLEDGLVQIGHSHLRIRAATDPLAPERPDLESLRSRHREYGALFVGTLLCVGFAAFSAWTDAPDNTPLAAARNLLSGAVLLGAWIGFWVLLGRAVRSRWHWAGNAAVTMAAAAAILWLAWGAGLLAFATGWPIVPWAGQIAGVLVAGVALYKHVGLASRLRRRACVVIATTIPLVSYVGYLWFVTHEHAADVNYLAQVDQIFPPSWSRGSGARLERFLDDSQELRDIADQRIADLPPQSGE